jgi:hypothetical protein
MICADMDMTTAFLIELYSLFANQKREAKQDLERYPARNGAQERKIFLIDQIDWVLQLSRPPSMLS